MSLILKKKLKEIWKFKKKTNFKKVKFIQSNLTKNQGIGVFFSFKSWIIWMYEKHISSLNLVELQFCKF